MAKRLRHRAYASIVICLLLATTLSGISFSNIPVVNASGTSVKYAGCRQSTYGVDPFPNDNEWERDIMTMASYWTGSQGTGIWIVGILAGEGQNYMLWTECNLQFPAPDNENYAHVIFDNTDFHESYLDYFDTHGIKVWLQVEPGLADVPTIIDLALDRYENHPCVIGCGVDVEWHKQTVHDWGIPVTDENAEIWENAVKSHNENYTLFLKHFDPTWMPPNYRGDIMFINDSQGFVSLDRMIAEFTAWASEFYPNLAGFQYGYERDKKWWSKLSNPPKDIGDALDTAISSDIANFWVDFTLRIVFPPLGEDTTGPVIENIASSDITQDSAKIKWDTNEVCDSVVYYGTTTPPGSTKSDVLKVISHTISLTGLSENTTYYYKVKSTDCSGNSTVKDNNGSYYTFTTTPADTTPPVITNVAASNITYNSATITWNTDELSNSVVKYGTSTPPGSTKSDNTMVTSHSINLTNLSASTKYYYEVQSTDAKSNTAVDDNNGSYYTFTTTAADTTPPTIENVDTYCIKLTTATILWDTDEPSDSLVKYGTTSGNYTDNKYDSADVTSHSIGLTGLTENTTYYYVVKSTDPSNNSSQSPEYSFTTYASGAQVMHVHYIYMYLETMGKNTNALAEIKIVDVADNPVPLAILYGHWEGATSDNDTGESDEYGIIDRWDLQSDSLRDPPPGTVFIFVVDNITKSGWTYEPEHNVESKDNIST